MLRRTLLSRLVLAGTVSSLPLSWGRVSAQTLDVADWTSKEVQEGFMKFARERRMPTDLNRWLNDPLVQQIDPYKVFDNIWNVGIKWVSAYLIDTGAGWVLIDTLHEPFVDRLIANINRAGVKLDEIRYVLMTHGHFDHVGGYYKLKPLMPNARFAMSERGWNEAFENARGAEHSPKTWKMLYEKDLVLKDGDEIKLGNNVFTALETPGHTWGTVSYMYDALYAGKRHRAVTVGGLGLNAISGPEQLEAYIESMHRLAAEELGVEVDMTAHPFSNGLTELIPEIVSLKPGQNHPLVNRQGYCKQLQRLSANAEQTLHELRGKR